MGHTAIIQEWVRQVVLFYINNFNFITHFEFGLCFIGVMNVVGGVNRIMLDNFSVPDTKKAVDIIAGKYETESSGGITYDTIRDYAEQGVDFISVGALTHSVKGLDMSFKACE